MNDREKMLGSAKVLPTLLKLAMPAILAQVINALYNMVDRMYIGRMEGGELALTGVGITFSIIMIISSFAGLFAIGGASVASIRMGEKKRDEAEKIMGCSFGLLILGSIILMAVLFLAKDTLLVWFGASSQTIGYANDYLSVYLLGTPFVLITLGMNIYINAQGFAGVAMASTVIGAVLNIILDPVLIFNCNMGVQGAAWATIISQLVSAIWIVGFLCSRKALLRLQWKHFVPRARQMRSILSLGVSPFIMQSTESLVLITFTSTLARFGDDLYIGAVTIMSSCMQLLLMPLMGLAQGAQPVISYNYGAKQFGRVRKTIRYALTMGMTFSTLVWLLSLCFPQLLVMIFNTKPELMQIAAPMMRVFMFGTFLYGGQIICQNCFLAMNRAGVSVFLALLRKIILLIPLVFLFASLYGNTGPFFAEPVADICAAITTITLFTLFVHKNLKEPSANA